jgi:sulfate permease, SulP family
MLVPKLFTTLQSYNRRQFGSDLVAGIIVGIVALPLAIAFAIASGVTPDRGMYTAIVAGFIISAIGGSRVQIGGPTGAFVVIVYGIVQRYGVDGLAVATIMAGVMLVGLGVARLGGAIKFIPFPVTLGFTSGIGLIIFSSQIKDLLGLKMGAVPAEFFEKWRAYFEHIGTINPQALGLSALALAIIVFWPRINRTLPSTFVALIVTTVLAWAAGMNVETIGTRFGSIPSSLPTPSLPKVPFSTWTAMVGPAVTIALLAAIESLLSAVVADAMIGAKHRSNMELVAQGVANIVSPLFGGIPATGAIARTATNVRMGGRTPIAGMIHAVTLLLITLFFGRWAVYIPFPTLAAILTMVSYNLSEWRSFRAELRAPRSDVAVLIATFVLTVVVDLTVAIEVGMVLAAFLFMRRMSEVTNIRMVTREFEEASPAEDLAPDPNAIQSRHVPEGVEVYEINGPFFFGAAEKFKDRVSFARKPKVLIVRMRNVPAIDSTGLHALRDLVRRTQREGTLVLLADVHTQPFVAVTRSDLMETLGAENVFGHIDPALNRARQHLGLPQEAPPPEAIPTVAREGAPPAA